MFVAASSNCFANLTLDAALERLVDLEYTAVEVIVHESGGHLKPSEVLADLDRAVRICRQTHRLTPIAYSVDIEAPEPLYYGQFAACCKLAKATKVVAIAVRSAELRHPVQRRGRATPRHGGAGRERRRGRRPGHGGRPHDPGPRYGGRALR